MSLLISSSAGRRIVAPSTGVWTPANLFDGGAAGFWFDFTDISALWQDTAGTSAVTTSGQSIARVNDKSGNGYSAIQATGTARPTYTESGADAWANYDGGDVLTMASSQTTMSFLHKDGGVFVGASVHPGTVANPDAAYIICGNNGAASSTRGFNFHYDDRSANSFDDCLRASVSRGVGSAFTYDFTSATGVFPANTKSSAFLNIPAGGPLETYVDNSSTGTSAKLNGASGLSATYNLDIGAGGNGVLKFVGKIYHVIAIDRDLTSTERSKLQTFLAA